MSSKRQLKYVIIAVVVLLGTALAVEAFRHSRTLVMGVKVVHGVEKARDTYEKTMYATHLAASGMLKTAKAIRTHHDEVAASPIGQDPKQAITAKAVLSKDVYLYNGIAKKYNLLMAETNWVLCDRGTLPPNITEPLPRNIELLP